MADYAPQELLALASRWMPSLKDSRRLKVHTDTSDFFQIDYGDIVMLGGRPYLIRQCAKEGRFGLGNILIYLVGKGNALTSELKSRGHPAFDQLRVEDVNIVFHNRVANLQKIYPYIPTPLNRVLLHFSRGANRFYDHTRQLLEDLGACEAQLGN